ncbi:glucose 1-dehydrogenase [Litoribacter ruber]|uniref:glucose 1-dehydrogenase n=1 Tax=Litoribacter ruber TaxID=702568 RepID=UPI001BD9F36B|nr:glucose 1-dehydrogenase [Litoribacter ruber]MBT0811886.1 glucose 1-dehydrogenase [Litoribacter ruber]
MIDQNLLLRNQTAIVTGGSSGIGQGIAIALGAAGANVVINFHGDEEGAKKTQQAVVDKGSKAIIVKGDVGKEEDVKMIFEETKKTFGELHILVNNAGIQEDKPFLEMSLEDWQKVIQTNLTGAFLCAQRAAKVFQEQGIKEEVSKACGKIIFISSVHETIPWSGRVNYATAKGGLKMMMKSIAQELAPKKIRVNSISPGAIKTPINEHEWKDEEGKKNMLKKIPYGRIGDTEDIAQAAVWLSSDQADYITGTSLYIDGGMTLYPSFQEK